MKRRLFLILVFVFCPLFGSAHFSPAHASAADERKAIEAHLNRVRLVFEKKEFDSLPKLCTPDCKFKMDTGQWIGNTPMVAQLKEEMQPLQNLKLTQKIKRITFKGSKATAETEQITLGAVTSPQENKTHTIRVIETMRYQLVKKAKGWLMTSWESVTGKSYVDGVLQKD